MHVPDETFQIVPLPIFTMVAMPNHCQFLDDPDARIMKMKDGRTHLGFKADHVTDLDTEIIIHATVCHGT